jgi:hypothetical protein
LSTSNPRNSTRNGTAVEKPVIELANVAYPATHDWVTPSARPPAKASGNDRRPPSTAAVAATNRTVVYVAGERENSGAPTTPARPARPNPSAHDTDETRLVSTPRACARSGRSTAARIARPMRVRCTTSHRPPAETAAAISTINWFESMRTESVRCQTSFGTGPRPGGLKMLSPFGMFASKVVMATSTTHSASWGIAIIMPTVATMRADCEARARWLKISLSSTNPSSGANSTIDTIAASHTGQPRPVFSSKNKNAVVKATAAWAKLNTPDVE